jgi:hypothetical protein
MAFAENIDPNNNGSQYAWAENLGWINLEPSGPGGPGVEVTDSGLTGWAWAENAGWISLSCQNTSSCGTNAYGVTNSLGTLGGFAWSENAGWINFAPTGAGVVINGCDGLFSGRAWSENAGWITFGSNGANPYQIATSWRLNCSDGNACTSDACDQASGLCTHGNANGSACDDGNPCTQGDVCSGGVCNSGAVILPAEVPATLRAMNKSTFTWSAVSGATRYDVVRGALATLPVGPGGGDEVCFDDLSVSSLADSTAPASGAGVWYVARGENSCGTGPYGQQRNGTPRLTTTCP